MLYGGAKIWVEYVYTTVSVTDDRSRIKQQAGKT